MNRRTFLAAAVLPVLYPLRGVAQTRRTDLTIRGDAFLYEVYSNREAFATHLASAHFKDFDAATRDWIGNKTVAQWRLSRGPSLPR